MGQKLFVGKYRIKSCRLRGWDYSLNSTYFVTICTKNRENFFGEIQNGKMKFNDIGRVVANEWQKTEKIRRNVELYEWVVMPNHFHGIVVILNNNVETCRGMSLRFGEFAKPISNSLSMIINHFKGSVQRWCNKNGHKYFSWQSRFHEHIIRSDNDLDNVCEYIINNPANWNRDRNNVN